MKRILCATLATALCAGLSAQEDSMLQITDFTDSSAMQEAGARIGDIILSYDGSLVHDLEELQSARDGATGLVSVEVRRGGETLSLEVEAGHLGVFLRVITPDHDIAPDAVRIENIGRLGWGLGMENSFMGCVFRIDEKYGRNLPYSDLLGLSGYAFRIHTFSETFCPSAPDATCGFDCGNYLLQTLGYCFQPRLLDSSELEERFKPMARTQAELEQAVLAGIDRGWPAIGIDLKQVPEWGIVTGYQHDGAELFCRTYFDTTSDYDLAEHFP